MTTDVAVHADSALAISAGQSFWTDKQMATLRQIGCEHASNGDLAVFFHVSTRTGLDPFARQIYMIERQGKWTIQTGIDGFRLIARRAVDRLGESLGYADTLWCGSDGKWVDVWLAAEAPAAAKVTVMRNGSPYPAVALLSEYQGTKRDGTPTSMWATKPALMLAKCAEALALRKAFPQDLSGIYTSDEMSANPSPAADESVMVDALARVAGATTPDAVRQVWRDFAGHLSADQRGRLQSVSAARIADLEDDQPPADEDGVIFGDGTGEALPEIVDAEIVEETLDYQHPASSGPPPASGPLARNIANRPATEKQVNFLTSLAKKAGHLDLAAYTDTQAAENVVGGLVSNPITDAHARLLIDALKAEA